MFRINKFYLTLELLNEQLLEDEFLIAMKMRHHAILGCQPAKVLTAIILETSDKISIN